MLYTLDDRGLDNRGLEPRRPEIAPDAWAADSAEIIGSVRMLARSSVWFNCVLRGDNDWLEIGEESNIQDGSVLHTDPGLPLRIGRGCTIGHQVMLHGCTIGENTLIGIQSVVLNHAEIGANSLVGAGSLVAPGKRFPDGVMLMGRPARVVRELSPEEIAGNRRSAAGYAENARRFREGLRRIVASP